MWDLTKSIGSFTWGMSLFGIQQMANLFTPSKATQAFEDVTRATEAELDNVFKAVFRAGDTLQRGLVDMTFGAFTGQIPDPTRMTQTVAEMRQQSARATQQNVRPSPNASGPPQSRQMPPNAAWPSQTRSKQTTSNGGPPAPQPGGQGAPGGATNAPGAAGGWGPMPGARPAPAPVPSAPPTPQPGSQGAPSGAANALHAVGVWGPMPGSGEK